MFRARILALAVRRPFPIENAAVIQVTSLKSAPSPTGYASSRWRNGANTGLTAAVGCRFPSARSFAPHKMKGATELAVGVSSAGFEFDGSHRRYLL